MKVAIASDHGGYELKEQIKTIMDEMNIDYQDLGTNSNDSVDYPDYIVPVTKKVLSKEVDRGILICGTGVGMSIAANKVKGIRAALVHDSFTARATRQHNDSNVLCLGGRNTGLNVAIDIVKVWLETEFEGGRHKKRIDKIKIIENSGD
ncbi:MAG: ribose 5-phosphate isomerase B [Vulcanibacillus sp.]